MSRELCMGLPFDRRITSLSVMRAIDWLHSSEMPETSSPISPITPQKQPITRSAARAATQKYHPIEEDI